MQIKKPHHRHHQSELVMTFPLARPHRVAHCFPPRSEASLAEKAPPAAVRSARSMHTRRRFSTLIEWLSVSFPWPFKSDASSFIMWHPTFRLFLTPRPSDVALGCFRWCPLHRSVKFLAAKLLQEAGKERLNDKPGRLGTFKWEKSLNLTQPPATPLSGQRCQFEVFSLPSLSLSLPFWKEEKTPNKATWINCGSCW